MVLLALALSIWVGIDGAVFGQADMSFCRAPNTVLQGACRFDPSYSALWRPLVNLVQYGPSDRFMAVEGLTTNGMLYALIAAAIGVYLALPLLGTIAKQLRALLNEWAPTVRASGHAPRLSGWTMSPGRKYRSAPFSESAVYASGGNVFK